MIELVLEDRCSTCGTCAQICPTDVFDWTEGQAPIPHVRRSATHATCVRRIARLMRFSSVRCARVAR
ncbi:4Fe-4S binding protein [Caballeronia sp. DA-9]|uniref:4Fe-4S binding protein n=1 Tax=Caballeronia sp. DA-9 TaxID=3436237 RepID=UPI003F67ADE6